MSETPRLKVFVSYARDDLAFADQLAAGLDLCGFAPLIDRTGISGGEDWQQRLAGMIRDADSVAFVLSPHSAGSSICAWEVDQAVRLSKRILPVLCAPLGGAEPSPFLKSLNYIFFYPEADAPGSGFGTGLKTLVAALNADVDWIREHTRLLARAAEWQAGGRLENRLLSGSDIADAKAWVARRPKDAPPPTDLHLDFIRASEAAEQARNSAEQKRLAEMAAAQAERGKALEAAEIAQKEKLEASRRLVRRTMIGAIAAAVLALAATGAGVVAYMKQQEAGKQAERAEKNLGAIKQALALLDTPSDQETFFARLELLAINYASQGRHQEAATLYERLVAMSEAKHGADSPAVAPSRAALARTYVRIGKLGEAEALLQRALPLNADGDYVNAVHAAAVLMDLEDVQRRLGKTAAADETRTKLAAVAKEQAYIEVPVFFGTDRSRKDGAADPAFGDDRARRLTLGKADMLVVNQRMARLLERTNRGSETTSSVSSAASRAVSALGSSAPAEEVKSRALEIYNRDDFIAKVRERAAGLKMPTPHAVVFVHGSGVSFDEAARQAALLAGGRAYRGVVFLYAWPARGDDGAKSYVYDRESAAQSQLYLRHFLEMVRDMTGIQRISLVAAGMGNQSLLATLRDVSPPAPSVPGAAVPQPPAGAATVAPPSPEFDQLIALLPDVDRDAFEYVIATIAGRAHGITLYASHNDRALGASQSFWGGVPRAGNVPDSGPLVLPAMDAIDVSAVRSPFEDGLEGSILSDIRQLLNTGARPPDKRSKAMKPVKAAKGVYWALRP